MMGATGAVGGCAMVALQATPQLAQLTLLTRRLLPDPVGPVTAQHRVDVLDPNTYAPLLTGYQSAICTLGIGQPSKVSQAEYVRIDRDAVIAFATACKRAGIAHFELLSSVGANAQSRSFYLRTKGQLQQALVDLNFERLSLFQPSMILTPTNRYGVVQGLLLALWPKISFLLQGGWRKYRGIPVGTLGAAMAANLFTKGQGTEILNWSEISALGSKEGS